MTTEEVLLYCLKYFAHMDEANAAIHTSPVRYSPITFRLAGILDATDYMTGDRTVIEVIDHVGQYEEDTGR